MTADAKQVRNMNVVATQGTDISLREDEFLSANNIVPVRRDAAKRALKYCLSDLEEFTRDKKWKDAIALFHPVAEKLPELVEHSLDGEVRAKLAFAMGQIKRFDEAIKELTVSIRIDPENFYLHSSLAYTAYNSLYAGANKEIFLRGRIRVERIELAHKHFKKAQELRQDGVTNFYRQGMLFKQIEDKPEKALPLFEKAVFNWDGLTKEQKEYRHQERKNFVKSLYQLAGSLLKQGHPGQALEVIERCLSEDEYSNHISLLFKYFALGKVQYHKNVYEAARDARP